MASSLGTKARIAASVLLATGFFDAVAGRFAFEPKAGKAPPAPDEGGALPSFRELAGAVHVHSSTYSDGASDVPTIMQAACEAGVDFVLLTDHNTQQPLRDGWEERYANDTPFLLVGTEITVEHGAFLLALDTPPDYEPVKHEKPQTSIDAVLARGGLPLVSLPFDVKHPWRDWEATGYEGLEVVNLSTLARRHINFLSLFWLLPVYQFRGPVATLRALMTRPDAALERWDRLTHGGRRPMIGLGALDAHALMKIGRKKYPIPSYADSFRATTTRFLVPPETGDGRERRAAVYEALRAGRCYIAYDCIGTPTGLSFTATHGSRGTRAQMGETLPASGGPVTFSVQVGGAKESGSTELPGLLVRLYRDGTVVAAAAAAGGGPGAWLTHTDSSPGAYRVEVCRYAFRVGPLFFGVRPWLFSNPIYVPCP